MEPFLRGWKARTSVPPFFRTITSRSLLSPYPVCSFPVSPTVFSGSSTLDSLGTSAILVRRSRPLTEDRKFPNNLVISVLRIYFRRDTVRVADDAGGPSHRYRRSPETVVSRTPRPCKVVSVGRETRECRTLLPRLPSLHPPPAENFFRDLFFFRLLRFSNLEFNGEVSSERNVKQS